MRARTHQQTNKNNRQLFCLMYFEWAHIDTHKHVKTQINKQTNSTNTESYFVLSIHFEWTRNHIYACARTHRQTKLTNTGSYFVWCAQIRNANKQTNTKSRLFNSISSLWAAAAITHNKSCHIWLEVDAVVASRKGIRQIWFTSLL